MSLLELSKKDSYWRAIALKICRNKFMADDIVQEMYLKLCNNDKDKNDFYVIIVMRNIFLDTIKKDKMFLDVDNYDFKDTDITFEIDDNEKELIESLKWYEKELIEMSYDKSFHEIQRELNINYQFVRRILNKTKTKWQDQKNKRD
jgi:DNA-directed RNA polymerase specialized sigma24 family protein